MELPISGYETNKENLTARMIAVEVLVEAICAHQFTNSGENLTASLKSAQAFKKEILSAVNPQQFNSVAVDARRCLEARLDAVIGHVRNS